jgi:esterase/lipase
MHLLGSRLAITPTSYQVGMTPIRLDSWTSCATLAVPILVGITAALALGNPRGEDDGTSRPRGIVKTLRLAAASFALSCLPILLVVFRGGERGDATVLTAWVAHQFIPWLAAAVFLSLLTERFAEGNSGVPAARSTSRARKWSAFTSLVVILFVHNVLTGPRMIVTADGDTTPDREPLANLLELDEHLAGSESQVRGLKPGCEKSIVWADHTTKGKTEFSLVYLHGFTASRKDIEPCCSQLQRHLKANMFMTRLAGHGCGPNGFRHVTPIEWLRDTQEAIRIGKAIGERVIVIGTSTGGTLACWAAAQNQDIAALVLISPNFGVQYDSPFQRLQVSLIRGPWGVQLARSFVPDAIFVGIAEPVTGQADVYTTQYRVEGLVALFSFLKFFDGVDLSQVSCPCLCLFSQDDDSVDRASVFRRCSELTSRDFQLLTRPEFVQHTLAGDLLNRSTAQQRAAPDPTPVAVQEILKFIAQLRERRPTEVVPGSS